MHRLKMIFIGVGSFYVVLLLFFYFFQERILFQPEKLPIDFVFDFEPKYEEFFLTAKDGTQLHAIHFKSQNPKGLILYFHGNRGSLKKWGKITSFFADKQYDVIVMDYRGYGKSGGQPAAQVLYSDAYEFYQYAMEKYHEDQIIIYGRSLGTGLATKVAAQNNPKKLILEAPYYSMTQAVNLWVPFFPVSALLRHKFPTYKFIKEVKCPIRIYHGKKDGVISYKSGKKLFGAIPHDDKKLISIAEGSHNDLVNFEEYLSSIDQEL